ncbi:hypothetical protein STEG23_023944 [Scotinomys teguina]
MGLEKTWLVFKEGVSERLSFKIAQNPGYENSLPLYLNDDALGLTEAPQACFEAQICDKGSTIDAACPVEESDVSTCALMRISTISGALEKPNSDNNYSSLS